MEHAQQIIIDFLSGNYDIIEFRYLYETKPEINALSFVIPNGEYGDFDNNNKKNIIAARGIEKNNGPWTAW